MFKDTNGKGFQITFSNGNTISVQWGYGNYCDNHFKEYNKENVNLWGHILESSDAEIAIWNSDGLWITKDFVNDLGDDVKGYCTPEEVLALMVEVAK